MRRSHDCGFRFFRCRAMLTTQPIRRVTSEPSKITMHHKRPRKPCKCDDSWKSLLRRWPRRLRQIILVRGVLVLRSRPWPYGRSLCMEQAGGDAVAGRPDMPCQIRIPCAASSGKRPLEHYSCKRPNTNIGAIPPSSGMR